MINMVNSNEASTDVSIDGHGKGTQVLPSGSLVHCFLIVERLEGNGAALVLQEPHFKNLMRNEI